MKANIIKTAALFSVLAVFAFSAPASANSLINNSAVGVVTGDIVQYEDTSIYIGAITFGTSDVSNVSVSATVDGNIIAARGTHISIGSYHAK